MSSSIEKENAWVFGVGDLVRYTPSRSLWDYYDGYGYPYTPYQNHRVGVMGIVVEKYQQYGSFASTYYKVKWMDSKTFSNEKHEDLALISRANCDRKQ